MQVIVDTSVWSLALRRRNVIPSPEVAALAELIADGRTVMLGAIRQEILSGIRHEDQFDRLRKTLDAFPDGALEKEDYIHAASICNLCLDAGVMTGNTDCLICAVAISRGMEVLTTDKDFQHIASVVPVHLHTP